MAASSAGSSTASTRCCDLTGTSGEIQTRGSTLFGHETVNVGAETQLKSSTLATVLSCLPQRGRHGLEHRHPGYFWL